ncbi:hypothetical protein LI036_05550 [bacterium 210917-DFI.7.65]|nr:hypothetical protein [bacterium 210917-DFI.7.65]
MYATRKTAVSKLLAIAMAIAMALTMTVSAFASDVQPYYDSETTIAGKVNVSSKTFTVTVQGPSSVTKVKMEATLYQKKLIGREEISTMSASSNSARCSKSQSAAIEKGKTYVIEVTAQVYSGGAWDTIEETITVKT